MLIKATKKPVTIEALKWDGENIDEIKAFLGSSYIGGENDADLKLVISTLEGDHLASVGDYIIKGVKGEFYPCKPDIFEKTYNLEREDNAHNFGWALEMLKEGKKVQRKGWNGKGMFITLQAGSTVDGDLMRNAPAKEFYAGQKCNICAHIDMKAADNTYVVGWLASQTDMLAEDWQLA